MIARALGAAVIGVAFTLCLGAWLVLHIAREDEREKQARR